MSIDSEYWRKEVESLKSQLQEKNEELKSLKRSFYFNQESLTQLQDRLGNCPVSGEITLKLKGVYHTFFKARINHPDYMDGRIDVIDRQIEEICKEVVRRHPLTNGGEIRYFKIRKGELMMEDTPSFRGVPIRYFRAQDGVLQICLKDVCEALGMERYDTVAIPIKKWFGVASLGVGTFAEEDGNDSFYTTVTIPQLYFLVFRSYTKRARKFGRWLEAEFFPYVMKQGVGEF